MGAAASLSTAQPGTEHRAPGTSFISRSPFPRSLLQACLTGDEQAWERLFQDSAPIIYAIARADFGLHREDAEDIVQMVHLKLYEHLEELRDPESFAAWLRRVTRRTIIDTLRQKRQTVSLEALREETGLELPDATARAFGNERARDGDGESVVVRLDVERALALLPPLYRDPVIQYLVEGKPQDEIGRLLGRPRSTIATQIQRGLQKLRRELSDAYAER